MDIPDKTLHPKIDKAEKDKRVRIVMDFIIDDMLSCDIEKQCIDKWKVTDRQARRYIRDARSKLQQQDVVVIENLRRQKIKSLEKQKRSLKTLYRGTPAGISAIMKVEKLICELQNLFPARKVELTGKDGNPIQTENKNIDEIDYTQISDSALLEITKARKPNVRQAAN